MIPIETLPQTKTTAGGKCPVDHHVHTVAKTPTIIPHLQSKRATDAVSCDEKGVWTVRGYHVARAVLRAETEQAGFKADKVMQTEGFMRPPILYLEGEPHREQRRQTARFFTPKATESYRAKMSAFADKVLAKLQRRKRADLTDLSMDMAVDVAAEVIGLTSSPLPGMKQRLDAFFKLKDDSNLKGWQQIQFSMVSGTMLGQFFLLDVIPAIEVRRRQPREDLISHLIASGYKPAEILTECVTYGAAGMATTREFIAVAAWHLLENPALKAWYLASNQAERYDFLHELLRVEPVVGTIQRIAREDITLAHGDHSVTIPKGAMMRVEVYEVNADESIVGNDPQMVCPVRHMHDDKAQPMVLSFGDGHHRCPGAYIAIQESDIFLRKLLALPNLSVEKFPVMEYSELVSGYELRDFIIHVS